MQEVTGARLLHDVRPGEARHLAEAIVTVDNSTVLHPGIGYDELLICKGVKERSEEVWIIITLTSPIYCITYYTCGCVNYFVKIAHK